MGTSAWWNRTGMQDESESKQFKLIFFLASMALLTVPYGTCHSLEIVPPCSGDSNSQPPHHPNIPTVHSRWIR